MNRRIESRERGNDTPDFHPLYAQIKELLIQRVMRGDWKPGELLPSEFKLAAEFKVSQGTVRKALDEMSAEKLVIRQQGKGTFVAARDGRSTPFHFFRIRPDSGGPWDPSTKLISVALDSATPAEADVLGLGRDENVYRITRTRSFGGAPMLLDQMALPQSRFNDLDVIYRRNEPTNIYVLLEREYGVLVVRAQEKLRAIVATEEDRKLLNLAEGTPLLAVERISFALDNSPVESRRVAVDTNHHHYASLLT
ncbi:MAG TPA: GntR family transcriptional regulator [Alphaproteobacteria bacterium]